MLITLCHATYHCIKKPTEIRDLWLVNSIEKNLIEYIPGINEDDYDAISDTKDIKRFISPKTNLCTAVKNWNGAASLSKGDLIVVIPDDMVPPYGWDIKLKELCKGINPIKHPFAIKIKDCESIKDTKMRHPVISRRFYEDFGLFDKRFRGVFCDDDITKRAFWESLILDGRAINFKHKQSNLFCNENTVSKSKNLINKQSEYDYGFKIIQEKYKYRKIIAPILLFGKKPRFLSFFFYSKLSFFARLISVFLVLINFKEVSRAIFFKIKNL